MNMNAQNMQTSRDNIQDQQTSQTRTDRRRTTSKELTFNVRSCHLAELEEVLQGAILCFSSYVRQHDHKGMMIRIPQYHLYDSN